MLIELHYYFRMRVKMDDGNPRGVRAKTNSLAEVLDELFELRTLQALCGCVDHEGDIHRAS